MGIDIRITSRIAKRFENRVVLETCTGAGFTTLSLAKAAKKSNAALVLTHQLLQKDPEYKEALKE